MANERGSYKTILLGLGFEWSVVTILFVSNFFITLLSYIPADIYTFSDVSTAMAKASFKPLRNVETVPEDEILYTKAALVLVVETTTYTFPERLTAIPLEFTKFPIDETRVASPLPTITPAVSLIENHSVLTFPHSKKDENEELEGHLIQALKLHAVFPIGNVSGKVVPIAER